MTQRILLIRLSAMGDIVFASPLVAALRRRYPDARLFWLVAQPFADLLLDDSLLDEVIVLRTRHWADLRRRRDFRGLLKDLVWFARDLRARVSTSWLTCRAS